MVISKVIRGIAPAVVLLTLALRCPAEENWGTVKGRVTWEGHLPKGGGDELFIVNGRDKGLKNVFVWLIDATNPAKPKAPPINPALKAAKAVTITIQAGPPRRFEPHAVAMREGQVLIAKNALAVLDSVCWHGEQGVNDGDATTIPPAGKIKISDLKASKMAIAVRSNMAPDPRAWVRVFDHPYYALTDASGKFEIKGAPAGKYNLVMWHEGIGWVHGGKTGRPVTIPAGKAVEVNEKTKSEE